MTRENLLRLIAESAYDVGFGAKTNFATFDLVEKAPGWISFITLAVGVYSLFIPALTNAQVTALLVVIGVTSLYLSLYNGSRERYDAEGKRLTAVFHKLRELYYEVKSLPDGNAPSLLIDAYRQAISDVTGRAVSKQVFLSDWYAHYKFFWQAEIGWVDEQLRFRFWRDKMPLSFALTVVAIAICIFSVVVWAPQLGLR